jgi:predicted outer membrane protein
MKRLACLVLTFGTSAFMSSAAPLPPYLSARPIDGMPVTKSDRAFLTDTATDLLLQTAAANAALEFTQNQYVAESARFTLQTLKEVQVDLEDIAKARGIALPLAGSLEKPRDLEHFLNSRNGTFEREYGRYTERNTRRLTGRFVDASRQADDPEVRAFAMRHVRWIEAAHRETKGVVSPPAVVRITRPVASGRVAEIFEPQRSVPLAAAESPASPGGSR